MSFRLYYFHDPMCSWCWAFRPVWNAIVAGLPDTVGVRRILGGLAPDTDQPMPAAMQTKLQGIWRQIEQTVPGTRFNFEFWVKCTPRRSTYPACRAVIAARSQDPHAEERMILAIQQAYYLQARNPADADTLIELADEIGLDHARFAAELVSPSVQETLLNEIELTRRLGVQGFPSLLLEASETFHTIRHDYRDAESVLQQVASLVVA